jgi:hypothetical protein
MSKPYGNAISLMAEPDGMRKQIRRIVTDSTPPEDPKDPETCTLVALLRAFADPATVAAVEERYRTGGIGYSEVKVRLADAIDAHVAPMRNRYQRLVSDPAELDARLARVSSTPASAPTGRSPGRWSPWASGRLTRDAVPHETPARIGDPGEDRNLRRADIAVFGVRGIAGRRAPA